MPFVNMGGQHKFVFTAQNFFRQLHADLMGFLRGNLTGSESLYQVATQVGALVNGVVACPFKFNVRSFSGTTEGGHQQLPIRLGGIADIVNGRFQC